MELRERRRCVRLPRKGIIRTGKYGKRLVGKEGSHLFPERLCFARFVPIPLGGAHTCVFVRVRARAPRLQSYLITAGVRQRSQLCLVRLGVATRSPIFFPSTYPRYIDFVLSFSRKRAKKRRAYRTSGRSTG